MWPNLFHRPLTDPALRCYDCVKCQATHRDGIDAEFDDHVLFQSKKGIYERAPTGKGEEFAAAMKELTAAGK